MNNALCTPAKSGQALVFAKAKTGRGTTSAKQTRSILLVAASCLVLAACGGDSSKVKFSESDYGVKASPRMVTDAKPVPKGGGRAVVGKPYKIAGKWYYPKDDPNYRKVGMASWYGPTFHGRMTANGEIFDRNGLTAAHTTMPLPSYARVTNVTNGRSMIVRVNDRGPFHGNRVIDLSERVATMLDTKKHGVAKVKVEYIGRAPLHGQDESYLMASYTGPGSVAPGATRPGTMLAFNRPSTRITGPVPAPKMRPYAAPSLVASASPTGYPAQQVASLDPGIVFEQSAATIQVASNNGFTNQVQEALQRQQTPTAYRAPAPQPTYQPAQPSFNSGLLPPPSSGPVQPTWTPGNAVSSFAAEDRVATAHDAFDNVSGGMGLKRLLIATAKGQQ
ncbi:septal ring lytic transglycosylase RlpA family protein [Pseudovibrio exalbescens]|uniref:septal ring lytic transglycosylase RlpA family protein n=1 Tax=Pseudovibrio exalbescens TaxID=197461 RepID=UPI002365D533|nr:septal ring lytic transglycosylase RlpA family protein [Pseudovibrio exalbescens]MDD7908823.1 septal ring lytic transglycosylase RlpA family protein [Pseudovibrio exalbescens]